MARDVKINIGAKDNASRVFRNVGVSVKRFDRETSETFRNVTKKSDLFGKSLASMALRFGPLAIAAIGTRKVFTGLATAFREIDAIAKKSTQLGILSDDLIAIRLAAAELSGAAASTVDMALQRMTRRLSEAAAGAGEAQGAIKELGLDAVKLNSMGPGRAFREIADALKSFSSQDQLRLAFKLFDSEGAVLVNTLKAGSVELLKFNKLAKDLGLTVSDDVKKQIQETNDAVGRLTLSLKGLWREMAGSVAPAVTKGATAGTGVFADITRSRDPGRAFENSENRFNPFLDIAFGGSEPKRVVRDRMDALLKDAVRGALEAEKVRAKAAAENLGEAVATGIKKGFKKTPLPTFSEEYFIPDAPVNPLQPLLDEKARRQAFQKVPGAIDGVMGDGLTKEIAKSIFPGFAAIGQAIGQLPGGEIRQKLQTPNLYAQEGRLKTRGSSSNPMLAEAKKQNKELVKLNKKIEDGIKVGIKNNPFANAFLMKKVQ